MKAIDRKLLRDLWELRAQSLAIALVIVGGVATLVMSLTTLDTLRRTQESFYRESRFADVFASLKRAPESLRRRLAELPGVERVETRVVAEVNLDVDGFTDPATGRLVSIPDDEEAFLNRLFIRRGRLPEPYRDDEVAVSEGFAGAHGLGPGDSVAAVINGHRKRLRIVGLALSPEYVYQIRPGDVIPDFKRFGILWMGREALGAAYDMDEAFNDLAVGLAHGASEEEVIERLDAILGRYGGLGAYARRDQLSHRFLSEEFEQLQAMATMFPAIFLSVAAFLLHVVVGRLVGTQRDQIAVLKAFGYGDLTIGLHYAKLVTCVALLGVAGGIVAGAWLGRLLSGFYTEFYRFPYMLFVLRAPAVLTAAGVSLAAALAGALGSVRRAARLPPAEAMRPETPARYRVSLIERLGLRRLSSPPTRMIFRNLERHPVKSAFSVVGIAFAFSILMVGNFQGDAIDYMMQVQFGFAERQDINVTFVEPTSRRALHDLVRLEGVERGEPFRYVPARLRAGSRSYRSGITGLEAGGDLRRPLDEDLEPLLLPPEGIVLESYLGSLLGVKPGDLLTVEVLEGSRPVRSLPVAAVVRQFVGLETFMELSALNRLLGEGNAISGAYLAVDSSRREDIYRAIDGMPRVAGASVVENAVESFYETIARVLLTFTFINTLLAASIAFGVVYNSARIAISERSRELASLRVLGFTRGEISYILLGELGLLTAAAIPVGFILGRALCGLMAAGLQSELYRIPATVAVKTYATAALAVLGSAVVSGLAARRQLHRLDLIAVLKTKE